MIKEKGFLCIELEGWLFMVLSRCRHFKMMSKSRSHAVRLIANDVIIFVSEVFENTEASSDQFCNKQYHL